MQYWIGSPDGVTFTPAGPNLAYTESADTVPVAMTEHSRRMDAGVLEVVGKNVYQFIGYALSNSTLVIGDGGLILIDPPEDVEKGLNVLEQIRKITDLPFRAIVYTHWHNDHYCGVKAFVSQEQVDAGECAIIAHRDFMDNVVSFLTSGTGPIIKSRTEYSLGSMLEVGPKGRVNSGCGPDFVMQTVTLIPPTILVDDRLEHTIAGVRMVHSWAPSEAVDEIITWFPDLDILQSAEVIQGESFPNLHTIRGSRYRDPQQWFLTIDRHLRPLPATVMIPSHGRLCNGKDEVEQVLRDYRDAIEFVYDQTIRWMNTGDLPDDIVRKVQLPDSLAASPYLGEFYGTVAHAIREIYTGELGFFNSDPTTLAPLHPVESSTRYVDLMGGRDAIMGAAKQAFGEGDYQWSAELATHLVRIDTAKSDTDARGLKADALRQIGYQTPNCNWRNYYLSAAAELENTLDTSHEVDLTAPDWIAALSVPDTLSALRARIAPERCGDAHAVIGFRVAGEDVSVGVHVRAGALELTDEIPASPDLVIEAPKPVLMAMTSAHGLYPVLSQAIKGGKAKLIVGDDATAQRLLGWFDPAPTGFVAQADR